MSYILEALRKAERERNRAKVPTLTTVHIPVYVARRWIALWAVMIVVLIGGALVWFLGPGPPAERAAQVEAQPQVGGAPAVGAPHPDSAPAATKEGAPPARARAESTAQASGARSGSEPHREAEARSRLVPPSVPQVPQAVAPPVQTMPPKAERSEGGQAPPSPPMPTLPREEMGQPRGEEAPIAAVPAPTVTPTLRDALTKMTLDMFVYTEVESDCIAVINGRRYVKGQRVDGLYLVEGITPQGVVLSYQGEQAVLRP